MNAFLQDLRFALRALRNAPGFTVATVLTLALGIGANSAIFSVVDAVLLKPLPFERANELVALYTRDAAGRRDFVSHPDLDDWTANVKSVSEIGCWIAQSVNLTGTEEPERVTGAFVNSSFLSVLGVSPARGRGFQTGEDRPGAQPVAVLTDGIWKRRFGGDPAIVGRSLNFNGEPYTVVGILPANFVFTPFEPDVLLPAAKYPNYTRDRAAASCMAIGRMRPGVKISQVQSEMDTITKQLEQAYPATNKNRGALVLALHEIIVEDLRPMVGAIAGAVAFVLLIGCTNVAGLLMTRVVGREKERAIRVALGAGRLRLMSHVLSEALLLSAAGGALGLAIAAWGVPPLGVLVADYLPPGIRITVDSRALTFTFVLAIVSALLVAAVPAWQSSFRDALASTRGAGAKAGGNRARGLLVVGEVALALVLLAGAGLMVKSGFALSRVTPGFDAKNVLMMEYRLPRNKYPSGPQQSEFHRQVVENIRSVPGVIGVSSVRAVPLGGNGSFTDFSVVGKPEAEPGQRPRGLFNTIDPDFLSTLRLPLLRGRGVGAQDQPDRPLVVLINETLQRRYFADRDPIGARITIIGSLTSSARTFEIVGVVGDIKQFAMTDSPYPQVYGALAQNPFIFTSLAVRTGGDPLPLANEIRKAIWRVDRDQPVWKVRTIESRMDAGQQPTRFLAWALGSYAALALILACIGIYGVVSNSVRQRTSEIGIRIALGARSSHIAKLVLRQGVIMAGIGVLIGLGASAWLTRFLAKQLFATQPIDLPVYLSVAVLLTSVTIAACLIPARRAVKVDPVDAMRHE